VKRKKLKSNEKKSWKDLKFNIIKNIKIFLLIKTKRKKVSELKMKNLLFSIFIFIFNIWSKIKMKMRTYYHQR